MRSKNLILFAILLILLIIQSSLPANLILIFLALITVFGTDDEALVVALLGGVLLDFVSGLPDGILTLGSLFTWFVLKFALTWLPKENRYILFIATALATGSFLVAVIVFNWLFGLAGLQTAFNYQYIFANKLWHDLLFNLLLIYPVYFVYILIKKYEEKSV